MFDLLLRYKGKQIVVELASGRQLAGTVTAVRPQDVCMETGEGTCIILTSAIQAVWERPPVGVFSMPAPGCNQMYAMPCYQAYACYELYNGQPCPQEFGHCPQKFASPCFNYFFQSE